MTVIREWYLSTGEIESGDGWTKYGWCVSYDVDDEWQFWALGTNFSLRKDAEHAVVYLAANKITAADYHLMPLKEREAIDRAVAENCIAW
jgi:hypothetical protein